MYDGGSPAGFSSKYWTKPVIVAFRTKRASSLKTRILFRIFRETSRCDVLLALELLDAGARFGSYFVSCGPAPLQELCPESVSNDYEGTERPANEELEDDMFIESSNELDVSDAVLILNVGVVN
jgi:hypothetical protein